MSHSPIRNANCKGSVAALFAKRRIHRRERAEREHQQNIAEDSSHYNVGVDRVFGKPCEIGSDGIERYKVDPHPADRFSQKEDRAEKKDVRREERGNELFACFSHDFASIRKNKSVYDTDA